MSKRSLVAISVLVTVLVLGFGLQGLLVAGDEEAEEASAPRGCTACHQGKYNFQNELKNIEDHPSTDASELQDCTQCHSFRTVEDSGTFAPNLANHLHFLHLSSEHFEGNCFSCHMINKEGELGMYDIVKQTKEEEEEEY